MNNYEIIKYNTRNNMEINKKLLEIHNINFEKEKNIKYIEEILENDRYCTFIIIIKDGDKLILENILGYIIYYDVDYAIDLFEIAIDPVYHDKKIGSFLIEETLKYLRYKENIDDEKKRVILEVRDNNEKLIHFYKKHGFVQISIRKNYYENCINGIIMEKKLK